MATNALSEEHRQKLDAIVLRMEAERQPESEIRFVVEDFKQKYGGQPPSSAPPSMLARGDAGGENVGDVGDTTPPSLWQRYKSGWVGSGEELGGVAGGVVNAVKGLASLPGQAIAAPGQWAQIGREFAERPGQTAKEIGAAGVEFAKGMIPYRETLGEVVQGKMPSAEQFGRETGALTVGALLGAKGPQAVKNAPSAAVRRTASSGSRMEAAGGMMERLPEKFGVTNSVERLKYTEAERLASNTTATAPVTNFLGRLAESRQQLGANPNPALRKSSGTQALMDELEGIYFDQTGAVRTEGLARMIKDVNSKIRTASGEEAGIWRQALGGLHEDMRLAARLTGDPAFSAFADAIHTSRLNYLRKDLETAVTKAMPKNRAGDSIIAKPGAVENWMNSHPRWMEQVEKAQPGLLKQIQSDLADIVPVSNVAAKSIPGSNFGSGRGVLGASVGHLMNSVLHLAPGLSEALGAIAGFVSRVGVPYPVSTVERAFTRTPSKPSIRGGVAGSVVANPPRAD